MTSESMGDSRPQVTREELLAMREVARKAIEEGIAIGTMSRAEMRPHDVSVYLDREYPLPAPEPQQAKGPSGDLWSLRGQILLREDPRGVSEHWDIVIERKDWPTVANLLCPFEDVVRATLEEMGVREVVCRGIEYDAGSERWQGLAYDIAKALPAILKRLEAR